jgi:hypothetical protein
MIAQKVLAAGIFGFGLAAFVAPTALRLGWVMDSVGMVLGVALGAMAGIMWYLAGQAEK